MTLQRPEEKVCAVCGRTSTQMVLVSTNTMGPPDLDLRPAPMARDTLDTQVECCPYCGYCAGDISEGASSASAVVESREYKAELDRGPFPELTRRFLCAARILSALNLHSEAAWTALRGAWAADDEEDHAAAKHCREQAIASFLAARAEFGFFLGEDDSQLGAEDALLADLFRRTGDFEAATAVAQEGISCGADEIVRQVLEFQIKLAEHGDTACHRIDEAVADAP